MLKSLISFQILMKQFGCTTPSELYRMNICKNEETVKLAFEFSKSLYDKRFRISNCSYPCKFLETKITSLSTFQKQSGVEVTFTFNIFIKTTINYHSYTELEMFAEIGGYVGLLLGISIFDLRNTLGFILKFWNK